MCSNVRYLFSVVRISYFLPLFVIFLFLLCCVLSGGVCVCCVHPNTMSWKVVDGFYQIHGIDAFWYSDECVWFWGQKVKIKVNRSRWNNVLATALYSTQSVALSSKFLVFTVRRSALHGLCDSNSVRLSVRLSVCHTRGLCPHGSTYDHNFFTIW